MSDDSHEPTSPPPIGGADGVDSLSAVQSARGGGDLPSAQPTDRSDHNDTRPPSALPSARPVQSAHRPPVEEDQAASEASKAAAAEAQASVLKEGGGAVPAAPVGLLSFAPGATQQNETLLGMGAAPVMVETALVTVPRLDDLIIKALADNYHICPAFDWIPAEYLENVVALLQPGKLEFAASAALIQTEKYWSRLACERWDKSTLDLGLHGNSWKRLYCEKHLKECLEKYHHSKQQHNYKRLLKEVEACKPFVHSLHLSELMSHLDLSDLLFDFPNLTSLHLKFGAKELGMDWDKSLFGMSLSDSLALSKLMTSTATINRLVLSENLMGDESVLLLLNGLHPNVNQTLTHLDLSRNKIGDIGARKLCALLDGGLSANESSAGSSGGNGANGPVGTVLVELLLADNQIRSSGAAAFGAALSNNRGLRKLDLSLNGLGEEGGSALLNGLTQHTTLKELSLGACDLAYDASESLLNLLRFNRSLESLHLASNELHGRTGGSALLDALKQNDQITVLDMRRNGITASVEVEMKQLLAKRLAIQKQQARKAFQKDWDAAL